LNEYGGEMTPASELSEGDYLRISYNMECYGDRTLDPDLAYMLGGYIAEGWITQNNAIYVSNQDPEFREVYKRNGFKPLKGRWDKLRIGSQQKIRDWMSLGIDPNKKCYSKEIPQAIFEANKETQKNFLQGMFDGDGSISEYGEINYTTTSEVLVRQLQQLLLNSGIVSNVHQTLDEKILKRGHTLPQGKQIQSAKDAYHLIIGRSQVAKFLEVAGFRIERKLHRAQNIARIDYKDNKLITVPKKYVKSQLTEIINSTGTSHKWFRDQRVRLDKLFDSKEDRKITFQLIRRLYEVLTQNFPLIVEEWECFFEDYLQDVFWDDIVSIEDSGKWNSGPNCSRHIFFPTKWYPGI
jgi:hypothetical protein